MDSVRNNLVWIRHLTPAKRAPGANVINVDVPNLFRNPLDATPPRRADATVMFVICPRCSVSDSCTRDVRTCIPICVIIICSLLFIIVYAKGGRPEINVSNNNILISNQAYDTLFRSTLFSMTKVWGPWRQFYMICNLYDTLWSQNKRVLYLACTFFNFFRRMFLLLNVFSPMHPLDRDELKTYFFWGWGRRCILPKIRLEMKKIK